MSIVSFKTQIYKKHFKRTAVGSGPPPDVNVLRVTFPHVSGHRRAVALAIATTIASARVPQARLVVGRNVDRQVALVEGGVVQHFALLVRPLGPLGVGDARVLGNVVAPGAREVHFPRVAEVVGRRQKIS